MLDVGGDRGAVEKCHASSAPSVAAGAEIAAGKYGVGTRAGGTATAVATDKDGKQYILTCAHVLAEPGSNPDDDLVFSPKFHHSSGVECNRPFGKVAAGITPAKTTTGSGTRVIAIDAALIEKAVGAEWSNAIHDIGMITGERDLVAELSPSLGFGEGVLLSDKDGKSFEVAVQKNGATTGHTYGVARRLHAATWGGFLLEIDAVVAPGETAPSKTYPLDVARSMAAFGYASKEDLAARINASHVVTATLGGSEAEPTLTITGPIFSNSGDSGAPIVDSAKKIVGIVQGGLAQLFHVPGGKEPIEIDLGKGWAVFIRPALDALGAQLATTLKIGPGSGSEGPTVQVPGIVAGGAFERRPPAFDAAVVARAERRLRATERGSRYGELARLHVDEIRRLVHHRRRVTVTWYRNRGPAFASALLGASKEPGWPIPTEIEGVALTTALAAMRNVLHAEASPALRAAIDAHGATILALVAAATSVDDLLRDDETAP